MLHEIVGLIELGYIARCKHQHNVASYGVLRPFDYGILCRRRG
jgi:hypothetical protein